MSVKFHEINIKPGDHFIVKWDGSIEVSVAISAWENRHIMVSGPLNCKYKKFFFSKDGVEELQEPANQSLEQTQ